MKILISDVKVFLADGVVEGYVYVDGASMVVGSGEPSDEHQFADMVIGGEGYVVLPGFINSLVYPETYGLRGVIDHVFVPGRKLFTVLSSLSGEESYYSSLMGFAELAYEGYTGVIAVAFNAADVARALRDSGLYGAVLVPVGCPGAEKLEWKRLVEEMPGGERVKPGILACGEPPSDPGPAEIVLRVVGDRVISVKPAETHGMLIEPLWSGRGAAGTGSMHLVTPWPFLSRVMGRGLPRLLDGWRLLGVEAGGEKGAANLIVVDAGEPPSLMISGSLVELASSRPRVETVISMGTIVVDGGHHMFVGRSAAEKARSVLSGLAEKLGGGENSVREDGG